MAKYITTTLPYVNADPHIGFALEVVQADVRARSMRLQNEEVFFLFGTDEHGQKIFQGAEKVGKSVQDYVDHYAEEVKKLAEALHLSNDAFVRTTDEAHVRAAQEMWRRCAANGDIYKKSYTGVYCVGCEMFKTEKELVDGHCALHPSLTPEEITEENYFFKLSKYQDYLVQYLSRPDAIVPEWRRLEALAFVNGGLEDFSISRERERLSWGVPVPDDDTQVMYVWFDALTGYISPLGWPQDVAGTFQKFWQEGNTLQMAGKDQVRFQSIMWQAMLASLGLSATDTIFYHGFINSGGQRMSKSLGNVISPYELVERYGTDATRYLLLRHVHPTEDTDITWERLDEWYLANLVNGLGNLVARVMKLAESNLPSPVSLTDGDRATDKEFLLRLESFRFNDALEYVFEMIGECDAYMTEREPFKKVKSEDAGIKQQGREDIEHLVHHVAKIATQLACSMPETSKTILAAVASNTKPENLFPRIEARA